MRILGIDYGLKKIGLAISEGGLAEPLGVIYNQSLAISRIASICDTKDVEKIVVGLPEGKIARKIQHFGKSLSKEAHLPVVFQEETLTTQEAVVKMIEAGRSRKYRQQKEDAFAAALILQRYLDSLPA